MILPTCAPNNQMSEHEAKFRHNCKEENHWGSQRSDRPFQQLIAQEAEVNELKANIKRTNKSQS